MLTKRGYFRLLNLRVKWFLKNFMNDLICSLIYSIITPIIQDFFTINFRPKLSWILFYKWWYCSHRLQCWLNYSMVKSLDYDIILKISPVITFTISSQNWLIWNIFKTSYGWTALILDNVIWGSFIFYRNLEPEQDGHLQFKLPSTQTSLSCWWLKKCFCNSLWDFSLGNDWPP